MPTKEASDRPRSISCTRPICRGALKNDTKRGLAKPSQSTTDDIAIETRLIATDKDNQLATALERLRGREVKK